jgi:hypothetical protein
LRAVIKMDGTIVRRMLAYLVYALLIARMAWDLLDCLRAQFHLAALALLAWDCLCLTQNWKYFQPTELAMDLRQLVGAFAYVSVAWALPGFNLEE